ncbi:extensin-like protein [Humibacillus xanthopallidus]|uniref:Extensin-like protein n=1 Tax=Humibacillus xanthopallidus TaxID=412689 RepID=A0A543PRT0_9MICO|nr:extensin family protein [Humibacillus xanthopallidus]TQN46787.1 extensin-like protein [Humibacillus xanthopallidus]
MEDTERRTPQGSRTSDGPQPTDDSRPLTRRRLLTIGALGVVAAGGTYAVTQAGGIPSLPDVPGLSGLSAPAPRELRIDPSPVNYTELQSRRAVGEAAYVYEVNGRRSAYYVTEAFGKRLDRWIALHRKHIGQAPDEIRSYGAWVRGSTTSWHSSGEAIDIARLRADGTDLVSLRHDLWRDAPASELRRRLALYWRTAAGLHHEFADVLTYLFDDAHANHIHVDIGRFGPEQPRLIRRSNAQVQAVQAMCRHVWGRSEVQITGVYDDVTRDATTRILEQAGGPGELADSRAAWQAFMVATMQRA